MPRILKTKVGRGGERELVLIEITIINNAQTILFRSWFKQTFEKNIFKKNQWKLNMEWVLNNIREFLINCIRCYTVIVLTFLEINVKVWSEMNDFFVFILNYSSQKKKTKVGWGGTDGDKKWNKYSWMFSNQYRGSQDD